MVPWLVNVGGHYDDDDYDDENYDDYDYDDDNAHLKICYQMVPWQESNHRT